MKSPKVYKRPCYYDHKNKRERHVWGEWSFYENGDRKSRICLRCKLKSQFNFSAQAIGDIFKKNYGAIENLVYRESPFMGIMKKFPIAGKVRR